MRSGQLSFWCWGMLALALAGCGAGPKGESMSASPVEAAVPEDVPALSGAPDVPIEPGDEPALAMESPGMGESSAEVDSMPPATRESAPAPKAMTSMSAAAASSADDWPGFQPRDAATTTRSTTAVPRTVPSASAVPTTSVDHVDEVVRRLDYGTVGFYTPSELPWGETFVQEVVLSPRDTPEQLRTAMTNPTAPAEFSRLQVANRMQAKLTGSGFEIEPLSEPVQAITSHRPTMWRFKVTPREHGPQELHLSLLAHIDVDGRDSALVVETKDALIEVDITVPQRLAGLVGAHWKWLWAGVVVPLITFVYRRKTGRRPPEQPIRYARAA